LEHFPLLQVFLEKSPPQCVPSALFFPATHLMVVPLFLHLDWVLHGPGLVAEQTDPAGRKVHWLVQQSALEPATPESHCSPASRSPFPQTDLAAPEAKSI